MVYSFLLLNLLTVYACWGNKLLFVALLINVFAWFEYRMRLVHQNIESGTRRYRRDQLGT